MREILFRAKTKNKHREWIIGLIGKIRNFDDEIEYYITEDPEIENIWLERQIDTSTLGQYTGLTDKNGKKIFEGDIVKRDFTLWHGEKKKTRETQIGVVFYSNTDCGFNLKNACNLRKPWDGDTLEIIGNIHDNPELLKGGKNG